MMFCLSSARSIAHTLKHLGAAALLATLAACGGGGGGGGGDSGVLEYTIGGSVSGLTGAGLVLRNNATGSLAVPASGNFSFATRIAAGATYTVSVATQPAGQTCTVANAVGTASANVSNITVACTINTEPPPPPLPSTRDIGGSVSGLTGAGLVLHNNGGNDLAVASNGAFTFSVRVPVGMPYAVSVATQPSAQQCSVANASGTTAAVDISNIAITCTGVTPPPPPPGSFNIGGSISGLNTAGLVLQNNGAERLSVPANATSFSFTMKVTAGGAYNVRIATQPGVTGSAQDCTVSSASGNAQADIASVRVSCGPMGPLTLLGSDPAAGATGVARTVHPTFNFSSPLDAATVTNERLLLADFSNKAPVPFTFAVSGSQVNLIPAARLLPLNDYVVGSAEGICGLRNECSPAGGGTAQFTTADNTFKGKQIASGSDAASAHNGESALALDDDGSALAAWVEPGQPGIRVSGYDATRGSWSSSRPISGEAGSSEAVRIAMDAAGNALLVWRQLNAANPAYRVIWAARYSKTSNSWDMPRVISHADGSNAGLPQIAVRPNGDLAVAWPRSDRGIGDSVWLRTSTTAANAPWLPNDAIGPQRIDDPLESRDTVGSVALAISPQSSSVTLAKLVVVWQARARSPANHRAIWGRVLRGSDGFLESARVLSGADIALATASEPQVAINDRGEARLVWRRTEADFSTAQTMQYGLGGWGSASSISPQTHNASEVRIAGNSRGGSSAQGFWISWIQAAIVGGQPISLAWVGHPGDPQPVQLSQQGDGSAMALRVVVDRAGNALANWLATTNTATTLVASRRNAGTGQWDPLGHARPVSQPGDAVCSFGPGLVSVNASGEVLVGWCSGPDAVGIQSLATRRFD